jgi:UDP-N-acetylmuramoyl-tripeptide--D-alanyl-D-alanine ligase
MIKSVLGDKASATKGNLNNHIGVPFTLLELTQDHDYAIVEAGTNHNGEIEYLSELIRPNVSVVTNIGESHIEYFETRENIYKEKTSLMNHMDQDGLIVLCAEDDLLRKYIPKPGQNLISYGIQHGINRPAELRWNAEGCAVFEFDGEEFEINAPGEHNLLNALCAISIGKYFEIETSEIKNRLSLWKPANMRSEIEVVNDITLFKDCYNSNPTSAKAALKVMEQKETDGQKIVVFGDMGELGNLAEHYHNDIAKEMLKIKLDLIYLCGPNSKVIEKTLVNQKRENVFHFDSIEELTKSLKPKVAPKDLILFKASRSMKFDKIIESIKETK